MKWGIRRFQNKDGTLTEAGKKRYMNLQVGDGKQLEKFTKDRAKDFLKNTNEDIDSVLLAGEDRLGDPKSPTLKALASVYDFDSEKETIASYANEYSDCTTQWMDRKAAIKSKEIGDKKFNELLDKALNQYHYDDELKTIVRDEFKDGYYDPQVLDQMTWVSYDKTKPADRNFLSRYSAAHENYYAGIDKIAKDILNNTGSKWLDQVSKTDDPSIKSFLIREALLLYSTGATNPVSAAVRKRNN